MSASDQMRAMLDQLMGTARNGQDASNTGHKFYDPEVCKSFLLECCPHEILASTRMDLGDCSKIHDLALRADYQLATSNKDYFYDVDSTEHLKAFIDDCDRRTELAKKRLAEAQEELSAEVASKAEKVHELAESVGKKLALAEQAGAEGKVDESIKLMEEVEDIRKKKIMAEQEYRNSMPASSYQQQKLRVCEVCSAYLGIHDNDRRLADHFGGKLHLGFIKIREKLENLMKNFEERRNIRKDARMRNPDMYDERSSGRGGGSNRAYYGRDRNRELERARSRELDRERKRDTDRDYYDRGHQRSRSGSRSRDHRRRRHKSRSRSRSRDRKHKQRRSKSRSRSRDRKQKKRSGSRSRYSRSPNGEERRSNSRRPETEFSA